MVDLSRLNQIERLVKATYATLDANLKTEAEELEKKLLAVLSTRQVSSKSKFLQFNYTMALPDGIVELGTGKVCVACSSVITGAGLTPK